MSNVKCAYIKFFFILIVFAGCTQMVAVPPHLIGVWRTSSPQYEDRYLKFTNNSLTYGIGDGKEVSHNIDKIDVSEESGATEYTFHYRDEEDEKWTLTLTYRPEGTIQLQNKNDIWEKIRPEDAG